MTPAVVAVGILLGPVLGCSKGSSGPERNHQHRARCDKEADVTGVQWTQRTTVMRDSIIYLRNNPSILFWEAGNSGITAGII